MTIDQLAAVVAEACLAEGVPHMFTGAFATGLYGTPRSTADVDVVVDVADPTAAARLASRLAPTVTFDPQVQFDTLTFGSRRIGSTSDVPPLVVELFSLFDDPFVREQFARRQERFVATIGRAVPVPTVEDLVIQKLRWGRGKDLDDARDVLAVHGLDSIDLNYVRGWCARHGTSDMLEATLRALPPDASPS
jgi:hypothetical protein